MFQSLHIRILIISLMLGCGAGLQAQDENAPQLPVSDPICSFFKNQQSAFFGNLLPPQENGGRIGAASGSRGTAGRLMKLTDMVAGALPPPPGGSRQSGSLNLANLGMIDQYLFSAMQSAGVQPADPTTDWEFIRRATLDLTGRIPDPNAVLAFVNDTTANKRAALVDQLLAKPEFNDKWTMYLGDLFKNVSSNAQINVYKPSVEAFYQYIKNAVATNKSYDQIARDLITAQGASSYNDGSIGLIVNGVVTGGPVQDIYDQQTANIADVFLGISHLNCLLCHNGAGHLTTLTMWGAQQTRYNAWGMAAFLSHTSTTSTAVAPPAVTPRYWSVADTGTKPYQLNTTTGNRPARQPIGPVSSVTPAYIFTGATPNAGESYRAALARMVTSDPQFARAAVNYYWAYFFGVGLVDPPDAFDPLRLDPDNPPPASSGFTLQPSNPRLLNALASAFAANRYDVKWLMRQIANSQAYQLSARYDGQWNEAWNNLYARKLVRRLWGEEIHDAIAVSSKVIPTYTDATYGTINYAMQFPEPLGTPDGANGHVSMLLDAFLRGNRDDQARSEDGSILQALDLMNDSYVMNRTSPTGPAGSLLQQSIGMTNSNLVNTLFLSVLSRYPTPQEMSAALGNLANAQTRNQEAQNLLWSLYNKVDFVFNY